jgi:large subunit ribosomal protein L13
MKSTIAKVPADSARKWFVVDADGAPLGRLAVQVANRLRGRGQRAYTPHVDTGDFVVVINADKVRLTGRKNEQKIYQRYSGYRGGLKSMTASELRERHPDRLVRLAVRGMMPDTVMGRRLFRRLKVYAGAEHPHAAQQPQQLQ